MGKVQAHRTDRHREPKVECREHWKTQRWQPRPDEQSNSLYLIVKDYVKLFCKLHSTVGTYQL